MKQSPTQGAPSPNPYPLSASTEGPSGAPEVTLTQLDGDPATVSRLMDMGLYPGVTFEVVQQMPWGGPYVLRVGTSLLAVRKEEFQCLKTR